MATIDSDVEPGGCEGAREESGLVGHARISEMAPPESRTARAPLASPRRKKRRLPRPAVDDRLVMPETRFEILDGKVEYVPPADEPHGVRQTKMAGLLEMHVVRGYQCASDMLTRTSAKNDVAPDASVYPAARDPVTGGRQLEDLAFEIVSTERLSHAAKKARTLKKRGVRRIFALDVERRRALEWSPEADSWEALPEDGVIEDRVFVRPLPLRPLIDASEIDDEAARALLAKGNPVLLAETDRVVVSRKIDVLLLFFETKGMPVSDEARARLQAPKNEAEVDRWLAQAFDGARIEDLLG
jgi:Uma2 family endonuclease